MALGTEHVVGTEEQDVTLLNWAQSQSTIYHQKKNAAFKYNLPLNDKVVLKAQNT
jgi:hypothetical protein